MRIEVELDADLVSLLTQVRAHHPGRLEEVVNEALGLGLIAKTKPRKRFRTGTLPNGPRMLENIDCVGKTLAWAEGENHK